MCSSFFCSHSNTFLSDQAQVEEEGGSISKPASPSPPSEALKDDDDSAENVVVVEDVCQQLVSLTV